MPAVRPYIVIQERQISIRAESPEDAVMQSKRSFDAASDTTNPELLTVEVTSVSARKEY